MKMSHTKNVSAAAERSYIRLEAFEENFAHLIRN